MKRRKTSWPVPAVFTLGLLSIAVGLLRIADVVGKYDHKVLLHTDHELLLEWLRAVSVDLAISGGLIALGLSALFFLFLHLFHRTSRIQHEAELLRQKNEAMEELNRKTRELAHHQRLQTLGMLTSSIAHEFNNLLTPIMGYSLMALEQLSPEDTELYDGIVEIYNSSRQAKEIISRLSDLSRKNTDSSFREVSPDEVIRKTLNVAAPAKPREVEVRLDLNCWDQRIRANEIQLSQLMLNLFLNGFHAMGERGVLTVSTSFDESTVQIRVSDTGCGIPGENLSKIFEPFFTTKEVGKGTGLGLAIAAQVVEDHRGEIEVDSVEGVGTSFTVRLPRAAISLSS